MHPKISSLKAFTGARIGMARVLVLTSLVTVSGTLLAIGRAKDARAATPVLGGASIPIAGKTATTQQLLPEIKPLTRIEPFGQDIDGDGIATAEEGAVDVDGDGKFTEVDMAAYGMTSYIVWATDEDLTLYSGRVCSAVCTNVPPFGQVCVVGENEAFNCVANSSGACTGTVGCSYPCYCPP
jgi:hypothetical protein